MHGESVATFVQNAAPEAAHIAPIKKSARSKVNDLSDLCLIDGFANAPEAKEPDIFAPVDAKEKAAPAPIAKKGVAGEQSQLAKGHGLVWEIRKALGRERVHGLGWTREQLAFVLKLSVVGVRKMEHPGTTPLKSIEARQKLLELAKTLENPGEEFAAYIEHEEAVLQG